MSPSRPRGVQDLRTGLDLSRKSGPRTPDGLTFELANLKRERRRLVTERENWLRKVRLIETRLAEIAAAERAIEEEVARLEADEAPELDGAAASARPGREGPRDDVVLRY